jgi:outer membrane protein
MKKKPFFLSIILGMVLFSINIVAQELWTLQECIDYAIENNLSVQQSKLDVMNAEHDLLQSKLNMVPSLNGSTGINLGWGRAPDPGTNIYVTQQTQNTFFGLNSEVTLFQGLQQVNNVRQLNFDYLAVKYDSDKIRNDIALNIAAAYLTILFNLELVNNAQRQLDITAEQIDRTAKQVEAGALPRGSLYDIEAQGASDEANLITAENNLLLAYLDLMQLLDLEASTKFDIDKPVLEITGTPTLLPAESIFNKAVEFMPEIKSADYRVQSAERALARSKGYNSPRFYVQGNYGTNISNQIRQDPTDFDSPPIPFDQQFGDNRNGAILFGLNVPIFNGYQVTTNTRKARVWKEAAEINLQNQKNQLRKNVEQAYADALAAYKTYISRNKSVAALSESFTYTEEMFNVGMVNVTDYNVSKLQLSSAESDLASAKYDYIFKVKILDFYLGRSLNLDDITGVSNE